MINQLIKIFNEILYLGATSSILIVLIVLIKRVFGKVLNAKWHYYVWFLLLVRLIIPITPESSLSALNLFYITAEQFHLPVNEISALTMEHTGNVNTTDTTLTNPPTIHGNTGNSDSTDTNTTSTINVSNYNSQSNHIPPIRILFYIWLSGIVLLTSYTIYINIAFAINIRRNYRRLHNPRINGILNECRRIVGIKRDISLFTTDRNRTPSLYTAFHTIILVSEEHLELLNDQEIKCIFLHELSHYKRKDIIVNWVVTLLQIIYFFNPLIWFAFYKVHEDCEISCDAAALKYLHEEQYQGYGNTVIRLIKLFSESNFIPSTAGLWNHKSNYKRRIIMISKYKKSKWTNTLLTLVLILIVGMVGLTGCRKATKDASNNDTIDITAAAEDITTAAEDITPATEGTGTSEVTTAPITPTPELTAAPITPTPELIATPGSSQATDQSDLKDLVALMGLSKDELITKLGKDYKKVDEGGLEFTQPEIRVWFNEKSITNQVYTDKSDIDFNGAKVGDDIKSFTEVFGKALRDNNEVSLFKVDDNYLSVYYDTNTKKTYAVYLLTEEVAAPVK